MGNSFQLNVNQIQEFLPHRAPFLLIDRVLGIYPPAHAKEEQGEALYAAMGTKVVALKNVSFNEWYFQGHFPGFAIMPGVLIIEAMAQAASFSVYPNLLPDLERLARDFRCILVGVDGARFRKPVVPGDCLRLEAEVLKRKGSLWIFRCKALVDSHLVAEADLLTNLVARGLT